MTHDSAPDLMITNLSLGPGDAMLSLRNKFGTMNLAHLVIGVIVVFIGIVLILALLPTITSFMGAANLSGGALAVAAIIPLVLVAVIILLALKMIDYF